MTTSQDYLKTISKQNQLLELERTKISTLQKSLEVCGLCCDYSHANCKCFHDYAGGPLRAPQSECGHIEAGWRKVDWLK